MVRFWYIAHKHIPIQAGNDIEMGICPIAFVKLDVRKRTIKTRREQSLSFEGFSPIWLFILVPSSVRVGFWQIRHSPLFSFYFFFILLLPRLTRTSTVSLNLSLDSWFSHQYININSLSSFKSFILSFSSSPRRSYVEDTSKYFAILSIYRRKDFFVPLSILNSYCDAVREAPTDLSTFSFVASAVQ